MTDRNYTHISVTEEVREALRDRCMTRDITYDRLLRELLDEEGRTTKP